MISLLIDHAENAQATCILAHGAGAPMDSDFMNQMAALLAAKNISVVRFEFPYMVERRETGKKRPPNPQLQLLECWRQVFGQVSQHQELPAPIFMGGKSMGGRMATLLAEELKPAGVIALGYPFHPAGKPEKLRTEHLGQGEVPHLILQGTRDALGNREEVDGYHLGSHIQLCWLEDGDHDLKPRKKSGFSHEQHLETAAQAICDFVKACLLQGFS